MYLVRAKTISGNVAVSGTYKEVIVLTKESADMILPMFDRCILYLVLENLSSIEVTAVVSEDKDAEVV